MFESHGKFCRFLPLKERWATAVLWATSSIALLGSWKLIQLPGPLDKTTVMHQSSSSSHNQNPRTFSSNSVQVLKLKFEAPEKPDPDIILDATPTATPSPTPSTQRRRSKGSSKLTIKPYRVAVAWSDSKNYEGTVVEER
jgi:hypothetical protein